MPRTAVTLCVLASLALALPAAAADRPVFLASTLGTGAPSSQPAGTTNKKKWTFDTTFYGWLAGIDGSVGVGRFSRDFEADFGDIFDNLDLGLMGAIEARNGRWGLLTNLVYVKTSSDFTGRFGGTTDFDSTYFLAEFAAAYRLTRDPMAKGQLDVLAGLRYQNVSLDITGPRGSSVDGDRNALDPLVGLRYAFPLSTKLYASLEGDVGGFGVDSDFTWNVIGILGYRMSSKMDFVLGYRYFDQSFSGDNNKSLDFAMFGPLVGVRLHW